MTLEVSSKKIFQYIILIILFQFPFNLNALTDSTIVRYDTIAIVPLKFDENRIEEYKNDKDFDYTEFKRTNTLLDKIKRWIENKLLKFFEWLFGQKKASNFLGKFLKVIPYVVFGIVLFFLLKFFLNINIKDIIKGKSSSTTVTYGDEEEIIRNKDIDKLIKEAISNSDYRLAIRYYYLKLLKLLEENEKIEWEHQKTNYDYYDEIKDQSLKQSFQQFTLWYDYIWYGKFNVNINEFNLIVNKFDLFFKENSRER